MMRYAIRKDGPDHVQESVVMQNRGGLAMNNDDSDDKIWVAKMTRAGQERAK